MLQCFLKKITVMLGSFSGVGNYGCRGKVFKAHIEISGDQYFTKNNEAGEFRLVYIQMKK